MSKIFHRQLHQAYPEIATGEGVYLYDKRGKAYLDASGGAAVSCLGHGNKVVNQAIKDQVDAIAFAHSGFFTNEAAEELAQYLCDNAPGELNYTYYLSGGSEANEAAMKLARQYHLERGNTKKSLYISRYQSYHGNTLGALSLGGNMQRRLPFQDILSDNVHFIDPCYAYRHQRDDESIMQYGKRAAGQLEDKILELGAENVAAFFAETVVGATLGCVPAVAGYFEEIRRICDKYDVLLILDEVMSGMGRCGFRFTFEYEGIVPDIATFAKGFGGGYQAIGGMIVQQKIYDTIAQGTGFFQHGHTYISHATACAAALAVQKEIDNMDLLEKVRYNETLFKAGLEKLKAKYAFIGDVRGLGYFWGMEFVQDYTLKTPFPKEAKVSAKLHRLAMEEGLIMYPGNGTKDGTLGDHLLLAPPLIYEAEHFEELFQKLDHILMKVIEQ